MTADPRDAASALLSAVVGSDVVRGVVGESLTSDIVTALAAGFVDEVGADGGEVLVGHDGGDSALELAADFGRGAQARGATVVDLGVCSTDEGCFASGSLNTPAALVTTGRHPAGPAAITLLRAGARDIGQDTGLAAIRDRAAEYLAEGMTPVSTPGGRREAELRARYAARLRALVELSGIRPLTVVVDAGHGAAAVTVPAVLGEAAGLAPLPITVIPLFFERDGREGAAQPRVTDPSEPAGQGDLVDLQNAVIQHAADLGLGFDSDAGRCVVVDETGALVDASAVGAIIARREIARARAAAPDEDIVVVHDLIVSRIVPETIEAAGAVPVLTGVGRSAIKAEMSATGAIFGCEHSARYHFRDLWDADSGLLAAMHLLGELGSQARPLSELAAEVTPYARSGEISSPVAELPGAYARIVEAFTGAADFDELDGLLVTGMTSADEPFWWFSVRPSRTESLLRINVEAGTPGEMVRIRDEVLALVNG
jgi:phosphomannomutase